ncbi:MAG TPA: RelA/SpoT family protein [Bacteroidales bacterium]|nr:RelA/SpoT family protein [Bacteroidales bacterium]
MEKEKIYLSEYATREYRKLLRYARESAVPVDVNQIHTALMLSGRACRRIHQQINEPMLVQSLQVAQIVVGEIGLGTAPACAALMHKFVENQSLSHDEIRNYLGEKIARQTYELAKLATVSNYTHEQAEAYRKMLFSLTDDIRVILVKLADRLYTLRNLDNEEPATQNRLSYEAFDIYAPIAHQLGLYQIKTELEDIALKYTNPDMYNYIVKKLQETAPARNRYIKDFIAPIKTELDKLQIRYTIKSRTKSIFSIYNKMRKQNIDFNEVYDLFAIRIILDAKSQDEQSECWKVFSVVTNLYPSNPDRMRDWITVPKSTGYESLHATVQGPEQKWVEVQIRTTRMDEIAEKGMAAHWKYKGRGTNSDFDEWLNKVREVLEKGQIDIADEEEELKLTQYAKEIFVFTPKGQLKVLPKGSTALDFAYEIHTDVGNSCIGAKVNGKSVPIRYELNNGDRVEIITSKNQKPKPDWLDFVITSKAKAKIKLALKEEVIQQAEIGKEIFKRRLRNWKIIYSDLLVSRLLKHYKLKNAIDFYALIANEKISLNEVKSIIKSTEKEPESVPDKIENVPLEKIVPGLTGMPEEVLEIDEKQLNNVEYKLAKCCSPIFGDEIFAFVTINDGIKIHRITCPNAPDMLSRYGYRVLKARWVGEDSNTNFQTAIKITGSNEIGILSKISDVIAKDLHVRMRSINIDTQENQFVGIIKLFVKDVKYLDMLIHKLLKIKGVYTAIRVDGI